MKIDYKPPNVILDDKLVIPYRFVISFYLKYRFIENDNQTTNLHSYVVDFHNKAIRVNGKYDIPLTTLTEIAAFIGKTDILCRICLYKIKAIKLYRQMESCSLLAAKQEVEDIIEKGRDSPFFRVFADNQALFFEM